MRCFTLVLGSESEAGRLHAAPSPETLSQRHGAPPRGSLGTLGSFRSLVRGVDSGQTRRDRILVRGGLENPRWCISIGAHRSAGRVSPGGKVFVSPLTNPRGAAQTRPRAQVAPTSAPPGLALLMRAMPARGAAVRTRRFAVRKLERVRNNAARRGANAQVSAPVCACGSCCFTSQRPSQQLLGFSIIIHFLLTAGLLDVLSAELSTSLHSYLFKEPWPINSMPGLNRRYFMDRYVCRALQGALSSTNSKLIMRQSEKVAPMLRSRRERKPSSLCAR